MDASEDLSERSSPAASGAAQACLSGMTTDCGLPLQLWPGGGTGRAARGTVRYHRLLAAVQGGRSRAGVA